MGRLTRQHRRLSRGSVTIMRHDGLMVMRPRRNGFRRAVAFCLLLAAASIAFKATVFVKDGAVTYEGRIERLAAGTPPEAMMARLMEMDPVTAYVIEQAGPTILYSLETWQDIKPKLSVAARALAS